jgi:hypothetical protein
MKSSLIAIAAVAAFAASPAFAQEMESYTEQQVADAAAAIETAALSDDASLNFWCGNAFIILNQVATNKGMTDDAASALAAADVLIGKAATEMIGLGVPEADFNALSQNFRIVAISQTAPGAEPDYAMEDCVAAAQAP